MLTTEIIDQYRDVIVQIATPSGMGTGFYLKEFDLIVTNRHVINGHGEVTLSGRTFPKVRSKVFFRDPVHDLAFIQTPANVIFPEVTIAKEKTPREGDKVIAIGHPYGLKYTATQGIVSKSDRVYNNVNYIQIDAAINPGNSGGPLLNELGEIVGVNTFIISNGDNLGFALPSKHLHQTLQDSLAKARANAARCGSCVTVITEKEVEESSGYCPNCGNKIDDNEMKPAPYKASGVSKVVEDIISKLGKDVDLSRVGPNAWDIEEGSAKIKITYNTHTKFVIGDALLCKLPQTNIAPLYEYLLRENYNLDGIIFGISNQDIFLSLLVFDGDLNIETGKILFENLFKKADHYDNILIEQFGAVPTREEVL